MKSKSFNVFKIYLFSIILTLVITLFLTIFFYFSKSKVNPKYVTLFLGIFLFGILGFLFGNSNQKKGLLSGMLIGVISIILIIIISILLNYKLVSTTFLKYGIYILSSSTFGIFGVNFKKIIK